MSIVIFNAFVYHCLNGVTFMDAGRKYNAAKLNKLLSISLLCPFLLRLRFIFIAFVVRASVKMNSAGQLYHTDFINFFLFFLRIHFFFKINSSTRNRLGVFRPKNSIIDSYLLNLLFLWFIAEKYK